MFNLFINRIGLYLDFKDNFKIYPFIHYAINNPIQFNTNFHPNYKYTISLFGPNFLGKKIPSFLVFK